jgi:hypothetical protein
MTDQFNRLYRLNISYLDGFPILDTELLRVNFEIFKGLSSTPNQSKVTIYNLNERTKKRLNAQEKLILSLVAGYPSNTDVLFLGNIRTISPPIIDNVDIKTEIFVADGDVGIRFGTIAQNFAPFTSLEQVIKAIVDNMEGVNAGTLNGLSGKKLSGRGESLTGDIKVLLDRLARAYKFSWSVQDGVLETMSISPEQSDTVIGSSETAYKINAGLGMIGKPIVKDNKQIKIKCLINPRLKPGRPIFVDSDNVNGFYKVLSMKIVGDTRGQEWFMEMDCVGLG